MDVASCLLQLNMLRISVCLFYGIAQARRLVSKRDRNDIEREVDGIVKRLMDTESDVEAREALRSNRMAFFAKQTTAINKYTRDFNNTLDAEEQTLFTRALQSSAFFSTETALHPVNLNSESAILKNTLVGRKWYLFTSECFKKLQVEKFKVDAKPRAMHAAIAEKIRMLERQERMTSDPIKLEMVSRKKRLLEKLLADKAKQQDIHLRSNVIAVNFLFLFNPLIRGAPSAGRNTDGICQINSIMVSLLNLMRVKKLEAGSDALSRAFAQVKEKSARPIFNILPIRKALGPEFEPSHLGWVGAYPGFLIQHLIDSWAPLRSMATGATGYWWRKETAVQLLVKVVPSSLQKLMELNSFKLSVLPELLLLKIWQWPLSVPPNIMVDYPRTLTLTNSAGTVVYDLRSTIEWLEYHHNAAIVWGDDGKCYKVDNEIVSAVACAPRATSELLFYEARPGYGQSLGLSYLTILSLALAFAASLCWWYWRNFRVQES